MDSLDNQSASDPNSEGKQENIAVDKLVTSETDGQKLIIYGDGTDASSLSKSINIGKLANTHAQDSSYTINICFLF